jgi:hypothetical protein
MVESSGLHYLTAEVINFMGLCGMRYSRSLFLKIYDYIISMIDDERVIVAYRDNKPIMIAFFSICRDWEPYHNKNTWQYLRNESDGHIAYIEKIVAMEYNKELRNLIEEVIVERFPTTKYGVWHRHKKCTDVRVTCSTKEKANVSHKGFKR